MKLITSPRIAVLENAHLLGGQVRHFWVDTCCIDKTSSAELSEAINSMFRWYRDAVCCFVLLEDVESSRKHEDGVAGDFEASRWFTRGWTLQELLAPRTVHFFDRMWECIGSRQSLVQRISRRTNIAEEIVLSGEWPLATVAQRFSWMAGRVTTRPEDLAYCLLGIFDVNMPMLYGEGERAFIRLQEEIIKQSDDQSIFAWDASNAVSGLEGVLARHPAQFRGGADVECLPDRSGPYALTNKGLQITLPIIELAERPGEKIALLACSDARDVSSRIGIKVKPDDTGLAKYTREPGPPITIPVQDHGMWQHSMRSVYLSKRVMRLGTRHRPLKWHIRGRTGPISGAEFVSAWPSDSWHVSDAGTMTMQIPPMNGVQAGSGIITTLLFKLSDHVDTFCLVLTLLPAVRTGSVKLVPGPRATAEKSIDDFLMELSRSYSSFTGPESARLTVSDGGNVSATLVPGEDRVLSVILSRGHT